MAKITLPNVTSGYSSATSINNAFDDIEQELQNKVLYRDNPTGEPNQMENDIDMNNQSILNANTVDTDVLVVAGSDLTSQVTNAATSATNAANSATAASNSATSAASSASSASTSASSAASSLASAQAVYDDFDDRYLGSKATAPTVDNDGNALAIGALYFNTTSSEMFVYTSVGWGGISSTATSTAAAISATAAQTAQTAAEAAKTAAETAQTGAETAETNAGTSETNAATSAATASTKATEAATSATAAASSASGASSSATTATTKASEAATSATNAASSASAAATSATAAASSESSVASNATAAATSATNAQTSATAAASSATSAAASASAASGYATTAAARLDDFDDIYLGPKSSAPALDNDGDPLQTGAIYWNTVTDKLQIWDGSAWQQAAFSATGTVISFNGRDGAVNLTTLDVSNALGGTPLNASLNLSELSNVITARSNLGVTATGQDTTYAYRANNLSDLASASTARTNLGLGSIATQASNNVNITGGTLNAVTITGLSDPTNSGDAANKNYVDNVVSGLVWKDAANLLAASNISLTGTTNTLVIDGHDALVAADAGYRILLTAQTTDSENGIYVYGDDGANYTLSRASDADVYTELEGASIFILEGTTYGNTGWVQDNYTLTDFTGQTWTQFSGAGSYAATGGIQLTGNEFSLTDTGVTANTYGSASTSLTATIDAKGRITSITSNPIAITNTQITGLGALATLSSVDASTIDDNSVGAAELNVTGNGTLGQVLTSDGDGTMSWADIDADPTMGGDLSGTASNAQLVANSVGTTEIADATVTIAKLSTTGTASASTYLRGDGAWSTVSGGITKGTGATGGQVWANAFTGLSANGTDVKTPQVAYSWTSSIINACDYQCAAKATQNGYETYVDSVDSTKLRARLRYETENCSKTNCACNC